MLQQQLQNNPYQGPLHTSHVPAPQQISSTNVLGIISIVLAGMCLMTCGFTCLPGLLLGLLGLKTQPNTTAILGVVFNGIIAIPMILLFVLGGIGAAIG